MLVKSIRNVAKHGVEYESRVHSCSCPIIFEDENISSGGEL